MSSRVVRGDKEGLLGGECAGIREKCGGEVVMSGKWKFVSFFR